MTMHHAMSEICSAFPAAEASTDPAFHGLLAMFEWHG
jgi:hypothetical protein